MTQTTLDEWAKDPLVDPEIRAHVYSLITALGGIGDDGTYALGDDALLCLRDLRKWLKFADAQLNRRDVARCMAEANLVKGDLLEILAKISPRVMQDKLKHKVAVACLELLVPLTWPFQIDAAEATVNHHKHGPYIQLAQIGYKRAILHYDRTHILQMAVRIALPSMAIPLRERSPRDEGIIRIALYFIRNIAMLVPPNSVPSDIDEAEISRSTTIDTFHDQDVFQTILSVASSIGEDFVTQDVVLLEILFFLLKGVDPEKLFMEEKKMRTKDTDELRNLIQKEKSMLAGYARHAPTRHNRFGTMIWMKRDDEKVSTISGQDILGKAQKTMQKMDTTKKWNKPKQTRRKKDDERESEEFDLPVALTESARKHLKTFIEEFLDSSFNPLFMHLRKAIERETERVEVRHSRQFFYLASWFLKAECARRRTIKERAANPKSAEALTAEDESYGLVAEVMNQETFILLNRFMQRSQDEKAWHDLNAGMKSFTQILLTVQEMSESALDDDQEIAENIQNRIFYEETTHDRVVGILRSYNGQGFGYLDACTELSHVFLRMLERYSKQNVDLQVRSRRRTRRIQKKKAKDTGTNDEEGHVSETEDIQVAQRTSSERKFDFARFGAKFVNQSSINTFVAFTKFYKELNTEQLKRAHRFFHRAAFKMDIGVLLYRVDILHLFNKMIKGPEGLDPESPTFKEWEEFVRHFFRSVIKRVQERPELVVEMLFSKIPATIYYLEHGHDREAPTRTPRAPAQLEVKPGMEVADQVGVAVGVLVNQQKSDALQWLRDVLSSAAEERKGWEEMEEARKQLAVQANPEGDDSAEKEEEEAPKPPSIFIKPDNEERRIALFKDNKLRLLLTLVGFTRLGEANDPAASWVIPPLLTSAALQASIDLIRKFEFDPPIYEDGKTAEDFIRSKTAAERRSTRRAEFDDDSEGNNGGSEEDLGEYAPGGPTARKSTAKKLVQRRRRERSPIELDDEEKSARAEARRQKELEKMAKAKLSTMFVHDSDDESDEERDREFFAREAALRESTGAHFKRLPVSDITGLEASKKRKNDEQPRKNSKRRKSPQKRRAGPFNDSSDDDGGEDSDDHISSRASSEDVVGTEVEEEAIDTPLSSQHAVPVQISDDGDDDDDDDDEDDVGVVKSSAPLARQQKDTAMADADADDDEDDEVPVARRSTARNTRGGFIIDSDSE
ncbi:timeless protein-domain-containing protein [Dendryphion nanum]|uniref:Topoisomerase 1-associated factor 1 n=1 Tax=Dendryphion nanum TaxID=256645 RepID=A0A9P9EKQ5_9PLEO|nr:timeless protein-domain-containing protein [Dendryphion nanum]